jgi:hypothetical protein
VSERIEEGDIVHYRDPDGTTHEAIADAPPKRGEILVRFTTKGRATLVPATRVTKASNQW